MANWVDRAFQPSDLQSGAEGAPSEARPEATLSLGEPSPRLGPDVSPSESVPRFVCGGGWMVGTVITTAALTVGILRFVGRLKALEAAGVPGRGGDAVLDPPGDEHQPAAITDLQLHVHAAETYPYGYPPAALARLANRSHGPRSLHEPRVYRPRDREESRGTMGRTAPPRPGVRS